MGRQLTFQQLVAGKYELLDVAGRGGMGTVFRAYQHGPGGFRRAVAVKKLYPHLAEQPVYRQMFIEEARIGAELRDPNITQIYDFVADGDDYYLNMEWIEGIELATYVEYAFQVARKPTRWDMMVGIAIGMLKGLSAAHERKDASGTPQPIVHRDVSPHNVIIGQLGTSRLIDFGLSLASDRTGEKTNPGIVKGKVAYLSPEVVRGERATPASDQFAAATTLWEALTGQRLFTGENPYETLSKISRAQVIPLLAVRPDVPDDLHDTIHRALSLDPGDRFASAREMANRLGSILADRSHWADTFEWVGRTVRQAREVLALGHRTQRPKANEPADDSAVIELDLDDVEEVAVSELIRLR